MRIGIFIDDYLPHDSGIITATVHLQRGLIELGHEVFIIAPKEPRHIDTGPNVIRVSSINPLMFHKTRAAVPTPRAISQILKLKLDVVHSITQYNMGVLADYVAKKTGVPHVTSSQTIFAEMLKYYPAQVLTAYLFYTQLYQIYFKERVRVSLPKVDEILTFNPRSLSVVKRQIWNGQNLFLNNVDAVIVPSDHMNSYLLKYNMKTRSDVIPNGIDVEFYNVERTRPFRKDGRLRVVSVGRLSDEKQQDVLINAVARTPHVDLDIVGDGPAMTAYRRLVRSLELEDRITFHGSQKQPYIRKVLASADVFALSSYNFDTQGVVLLEAAAAGLPIIYCDGNLSDFVVPKGSILVKPKAAGFEKGFKKLLDEDADLELMGAASQEFVQQFDYTHFARKTVQVYKEVLEDF